MFHSEHTARVVLAVFVAMMTLVSPLHAEGFLQNIFINKIPLKANDKAEINSFFIAQVQASKHSLSCFSKATKQKVALQCAKSMDKIMARKMQAPKFDEMQNRVKGMQWNSKQKTILINEVRLNLKHHQQAINCISKAATMGDLNRCFPKDK